MKEIYYLLNSLVCTAFIVVNTAFWGTVSVTSILYSPRGRVAFLCMKWWSKTSLWFCRVRIHVKGLDNIKREHIQILASNHSSHFDIFVLSALSPVKFGWVSKAEIFKIPFLGWHMKAQGYISIERSNPDKARESLNLAAESIRAGKRIALFPEGTRSRGEELLPFKKGLFHLCLKTGVPIVPMYMHGTHSVLPAHTLIVRPGDVYVTVGKELPTSDYGPDEIDRLMSDLRARMMELKSEMERTTTEPLEAEECPA